MPSTVVNPQDTRSFDARQQGYSVKVSKTQWSHVVRFIAMDSRGTIIAEGTVPVGVPDREFLVHQNVGFNIANVGEWDMEVSWP